MDIQASGGNSINIAEALRNEPTGILIGEIREVVIIVDEPNDD